MILRQREMYCDKGQNEIGCGQRALNPDCNVDCVKLTIGLVLAILFEGKCSFDMLI